MKRVAQFVLIAAAAGLAAHFAVVLLAPRLIMNAAMSRLSDDWSRLNRWTHAPRVSAQSRGVVRPSPDLAYSACVFDLSDGPVRIAAKAWPHYMSLSLYGANTDNFLVISDREAPDGVDIVLARPGQRLPRDGRAVVLSPSRRGVALVRRLAPTLERFAAADRLRREDICAPLAPISR